VRSPSPRFAREWSSPCCCGGRSRFRGRFRFWLWDWAYSAKLRFDRHGGSTGRTQATPEVITSTSPFLPVAIRRAFVRHRSGKRFQAGRTLRPAGPQPCRHRHRARCQIHLRAKSARHRRRRVDRQRDLPAAILGTFATPAGGRSTSPRIIPKWIVSSMSARTRQRTRPMCSDGPSAPPSD
jgi:hypothetical protein